MTLCFMLRDYLNKRNKAKFNYEMCLAILIIILYVEVNYKLYKMLKSWTGGAVIFSFWMIVHCCFLACTLHLIIIYILADKAKVNTKTAESSKGMKCTKKSVGNGNFNEVKHKNRIESDKK